MELSDISDFKDIKPIGFGPGIPGYGNKRNVSTKGLNFLSNNRLTHKIRSIRINRNYVSAISNAINLGYRLIDYSSSYGDGSLLHQAIKRSNISREQLVITARISNKAQINKCVREEFFSFLNNMNLDYVDILQFHWPVTGIYLESWKELERLKEEGYAKHLGVANCHQHHIEEILKICKYCPEIGQFEIHPLFTQKPLIDFYKKNNILVEAYTPIARYDERLVRLPLLKRLEKKYNKTFVQIILRWHVQNGIIPLVRSMSKEHQHENYDIFDFELTNEDMIAIDAININSRLRYDPDNCDFSIL